MAVAFGAVGAAVTGSSSVAPLFPAGIAAQQLLVLCVASKYTVPDTPAGWIAPANYTGTGGTGAPGLNTGPSTATIFVREADGTETGSVAVALPGGNCAGAFIARYTKAANRRWDYACALGADNDNAVGLTVFYTSDPGVRISDVLVGLTAAHTSAGVIGSGSFFWTGVNTFGTGGQRLNVDVNVGDRLAATLNDRFMNSGSSTGIPGRLEMSTLTTPNSGGGVVLRLREVDPVRPRSPRPTWPTSSFDAGLPI